MGGCARHMVTLATSYRNTCLAKTNLCDYHVQVDHVERKTFWTVKDWYLLRRYFPYRDLVEVEVFRRRPGLRTLTKTPTRVSHVARPTRVGGVKRPLLDGGL